MAFPKKTNHCTSDALNALCKNVIDIRHKSQQQHRSSIMTNFSPVNRLLLQTEVRMEAMRNRWNDCIAAIERIAVRNPAEVFVDHVYQPDAVWLK
uniref:Uncharacterized protein n=1 Tax=Physcomitrium patens TaxID=3218 RepID=A0A2K1IZS7_PHYPA|nr:hypothetical protein PHYPA_022669 [Physcomitrium patens]